MNDSESAILETIPYRTIILVSSYFILVTIAGVILNLLTIFALALGNNISKEVRMQLINLAIADLIMAAFFPTTMMTDNILYFPFRGPWLWCAMSFGISASAAHASLLGNAAIGLERFIVVYFPFRAARYTQKQKFIVICLVWIIATAPQILTAHHSKLMTLRNGNTYCEIGFDRIIPIYQWLEGFQSIVPTVIIIISYTLVFIKLCARKKSEIVTKHSSITSSQAIDKLQMMLVVDAFLSLIAWLPRDLYFVILRYTNVDMSTYSLDRFTMDAGLAALTCTNAFTTPLVYLIFNKYFRTDVKQLFRRVPCRKFSSASINAVRSLEAPQSSRSKVDSSIIEMSTSESQACTPTLYSLRTTSPF